MNAIREWDATGEKIKGLIAKFMRNKPLLKNWLRPRETGHAAFFISFFCNDFLQN